MDRNWETPLVPPGHSRGEPGSLGGGQDYPEELRGEEPGARGG